MREMTKQGGAGEAAQRRFLATLLTLTALTTLPACSSSTQVYRDYGAEQVWNAMKAVAESPTYDDWKIVSNDVWVDEPARRIEIYRVLRRVLYNPNAPPNAQTQEWRFQVTMTELTPPTAKIASLDFQLPTNAQREIDRYFRDVYDLLIGLPGEQASPLGRDQGLDDLGLDAPARQDPQPVDFLGPDDVMDPG